LNPRLVSLLTSKLNGWLGRSSQEHPMDTKQMLFTAHNPAVLDGLDLNDPDIRLFAVERNNNGHTSIRRIEMTPELNKMNEQYPLSRLWMMGHLGAVPNV
jgi:hypothetical protein